MEPNPRKILGLFSELPRFEDGRIDYSNSDRAPVLICFVRYLNRILLLKRSDKVGIYKGMWDTVAGYIDDKKRLPDKVKEELKEELGLDFRKIKSIKYSEPYIFVDEEIGKTWIRYPILVELTSMPKIKLNKEHTDFTWINPRDLLDYITTPGLAITLRKLG